VEIQTNWFRGDDETVDSCMEHKGDAVALLNAFDMRESAKEAAREFASGLPDLPTSTQEGEEVDKYGNPTSGDSLPYCCFPDCGCDGARLCMAESGANAASCAMNIERGSLP
jgi:hypothetical protein